MNGTEKLAVGLVESGRSYWLPILGTGFLSKATNTKLKTRSKKYTIILLYYPWCFYGISTVVISFNCILCNLNDIIGIPTIRAADWTDKN